MVAPEPAMTTEQIAAAVGMSRQGVEYALRRALEKIREPMRAILEDKRTREAWEGIPGLTPGCKWTRPARGCP